MIPRTLPAEAPLDGQGRAMLDPLREESLRPAELIARLHLRADAVVADVGAGPGFLTLPLARAVPHGIVIAADIRADYLALAAERATAAKLINVRTRVIPADRPALDPRSVDLALLCQVDHYLRDRASYFAALIPALRPGGRIALINYVRYRDADLVAARQAKLHVVDEWRPSAPFFMIIVEPDRP